MRLGRNRIAYQNKRTSGFKVDNLKGLEGPLFEGRCYLGDVDYRFHGSGINGPGRSLRIFASRSFQRGGRYSYS